MTMPAMCRQPTIVKAVNATSASSINCTGKPRVRAKSASHATRAMRRPKKPKKRSASTVSVASITKSVCPTAKMSPKR